MYHLVNIYDGMCNSTESGCAICKIWKSHMSLVRDIQSGLRIRNDFDVKKKYPQNADL